MAHLIGEVVAERSGAAVLMTILYMYDRASEAR